MEAQPEHNIPGVRPFPNTPSDVSCSSGPCSAVSTRETSPASSTYHPLDESSAARDSFILCSGHPVAIPSAGPDQSRLFHNSCRPRPGLEATIPSPLEMNPHPFQSISGGSRSNSSSSSSNNNKVAAEDLRLSHTSSGATPDDSNLRHRLPSNQQQQFRQVLAPTPSQQHLQSIPPPSASIHRVVRNPNWRSSAVSLDNLTSSPSPINTFTEPSSCPPRDTPTRDFPTASSPPFLRSPVSNFDPRSSSSSLLTHTTYVPIAGLGFSSNSETSCSSSSTQYRDKHPFETHTIPFNNIAVNMRPQNGKLIADSAMDRSMAYCYDRGGGEYTRLVPVDMLPMDLEAIPRRVNTDEGMIVLPVPRQPGADGQPADAHLEQQRVATPPSSPIGNGNGFATTDSIQSRIDSIVSASPGPGAGPLVLATRGFDGSTPTRAMTSQPTSAGGSSGRREKIYCDKWIHDGTCAFTQQGCKYKHEMPHDRETQEKLGLFHGYPTWWKKQALENQRPLAIDDRPVALGSGRPALPGITSSTSVGTGVSNSVVSSNWRAGPGPVVGGAGGAQRSPSSPTPMGGGAGVNRSIGFGGAGRGSGRQVRTFACFQPPTYGPIAPPSRAGASASASASTTAAAPVPTTRNTRSLTASSPTGTNDTGGGAPYGGTQRSVFESGNPFAPLGELVQQASARTPVVRREDPESSSGDNTAADGEQRGAPL